MKTVHNKIYLDNASSTKASNDALNAHKSTLEGYFGNPSSLHSYGREAKEILESARNKIAGVINSKPNEIVFTSGGTESINLAIQGVAKGYRRQCKKPGHIITSTIEHEAVLKTIEDLQKDGWQVDFLPVNKLGQIEIDKLQNLIKNTTALISIMYANNEIGTIQPIAELGKVITGINRVRQKQKLQPIYFHTDACQAGQLLNLDTKILKVDLLTLNSSKLKGGKGAGILYIKSGVKIEPIIFGGGQEFGLRSGTENIEAIAGMSVALYEAQKNKTKEIRNLFKLQTVLEQKLKIIKDIKINGPKNISLDPSKINFGLQKLPGLTNFTIKGLDAEAVMIYLDAKGYAVATGSACSTADTKPSHVLTAIGLSPKQARSSLRISTDNEINNTKISNFIKALKQTVVILKKTRQELS